VSGVLIFVVLPLSITSKVFNSGKVGNIIFLTK